MNLRIYYWPLYDKWKQFAKKLTSLRDKLPLPSLSAWENTSPETSMHNAASKTNNTVK